MHLKNRVMMKPTETMKNRRFNFFNSNSKNTQMRALLLTGLLAFTGFGVFAQKLDKAKDLLGKNKLPEAKTEIDNFLAIEKNQNSADAWYTKAKIYTTIGNDEALKATVPNARETAVESLMKYAALDSAANKDEAKRFLALNIDNRKPLVDLYQGFSKDAATFFNAGNFKDALTNFKASYGIFDFMSSKGWTNNLKLDTTTALYAGISAEKAQLPDEAAIYYGKIAENKATGEGFVEIYKWLADHHYKKKDVETAQKFLTLGKEVYPKDPFWPEFELDMMREGGDKEKLFSKYEEVIASNPENHLYHFNYGVELYQAAYNADSAQRPANSKEMIEKSIKHLNESVKLNGEYSNSHLLLGQIYYNQGVDINNVNKTIRPKAGAKLNATELKKKEDLRVEMNKKYDEALVHFNKVDEILGAQGKLKAEQKAQLKDTYDLMISIYEQRQDKDKAAAFTDKFNNVEKNH